MRDLEAESMAEALQYVTGITVHQGEGNRDQFVIRGNSTTADSSSTACGTTPRCSATPTTSSASRC